MAISITKPTVGGNEDTWGSTLNTQLTAIESTFNGSGTGKATVAPDLSTLTINGTNVTATAAELNKMDGVTASTSELNKLDGLTATTAELNKIDGFTGVAADLNYAKDLRATGVSTTEFDKLDGLTATTAELNYTDGVTSNIQTQLNGKQATITGAATTIDTENLTANRALISNGSGKVAASSTITTTELGYLNGVTSNIQTQINNAGASTTAGAVGTYIFAGGGNNITDQFGDTEAGSNLTPAALRYTGAAAASSYSSYYYASQDESLSGTWRRMGGYHPSYPSLTIFVRIS